MISFIEAKNKISERTNALPSCNLLLDNALGCILAEDIISPIDLPPFDNSAMDGYAICHSRESGNPKCAKGIPAFAGMTVSQIIKAGDCPQPLEEGTCAKIMTGAAMPEGADTVVPVEDVIASPSPLMPVRRHFGGGEGWGEGDIVAFNKPFKKGQHVRYKGEDIKNGELIARKGAVVNSRMVALLAALGLDKISVIPKPCIAVVVTGSELQNSGTKLGFGKIFDSNSHALKALLKETDIIPEIHLLADDREKIYLTIKEVIKKCDILITVGGVSVGDYDYVKEAFKQLEIEEIFHKVAIKPGKPLFFGVKGDSPHFRRGTVPFSKGEREKLIFGLPGNPVSCIVTFEQFVKPAIYKMMGKRYEPTLQKAIALEDIKGSKGKTDFLRGIYDENNGAFQVRPAGNQGSAMLKPLALANCTIIIPEEKDKIEKGEFVEIEFWSSVMPEADQPLAGALACADLAHFGAP